MQDPRNKYAAAGCALAALCAMPALGQAPRINELVVNHTGADVDEYVEIYGALNADYAAFSLLVVEGDSGSTLGVIDRVFPVGTTDTDGFWTTGFLNNRLENGTLTLLLVKHFSGSPGLDLDADDDGLIDLAPPWTRLVDDVAVGDDGSGDLTYSRAVLSPGFDGRSTTPGGASRLPNGIDTDTVGDWVRNDFDGDGLPHYPEAQPAASGEAVNTPGTVNRPGFTPPPPLPPPGLIINEIDVDTPGSDTAEFIELYDGGIGHTPLDDLVVVLFNGTTDQSYRTFDLDGAATDSAGFFVLGGPAVSPPPDVLLPSSVLQNGTDAVALYAGDADDFPNGTPVTTVFLVDAIVYETDDDIDPGLLTLLHPGEEQANENGRDTKDAASLQRLPNGTGGARNTTTYLPFPPSPGSVNGGADLALRKRITTVYQDEEQHLVTFILLLTNDGPATATGIEVTDHLPPGMTFVRAAASLGRVDALAAVWKVDALPPGDRATLDLTVRVDAEGVLLNRAEVTAVHEPDPDSTPGDGQGDDAGVAALGHAVSNAAPGLPRGDRFQADLRLSMEALPTPTPAPGDSVTLVLMITNDGPSGTAGVEVTIRLPEGLTYAADTGAGRYEPASGVWDVDHLGMGASKRLELTALVGHASSFTTIAEVTRHHLPDPDAYPANNAPEEDDWASVTLQPQGINASKAGVQNPVASRLEGVALTSNYLNPFLRETTLTYHVPRTTHVDLTIYDLLGRHVETLVSTVREPGLHAALWNATAYPAGYYVARLQVENKVVTRILMRIR